MIYDTMIYTFYYIHVYIDCVRMIPSPQYSTPPLHGPNNEVSSLRKLWVSFDMDQNRPPNLIVG